MFVLHKAMQDILLSIMGCETNSFILEPEALFSLDSFNIVCMKDGIPVKRPCISSITTVDCINGLFAGMSRKDFKTKNAGESFRNPL